LWPFPWWLWPRLHLLPISLLLRYVTADENGHFVTSMRVFAGDQDIIVDAEFLIGTVNCDENRRRERDCSVTIAAGDNYYFIYEGNLIDALIDGEVQLGIDFCDQVDGFVTTIEVRNNDTVATDFGSWDTLKAQYR
jgi:hypothetical protein